MATPFAAPTDVATLLKVTFDTDETLQCEMVLAAISAAMRAKLPSLDTWIADTSTDPVLAKFAACDIAKDYIQVTKAAGVKSETHPEYAVVFQDFDGATLEDAVDKWIDLLTPAPNRTARDRAFSIHPG